MYNEFYGFSENPFNVTPGARFLFETLSHLEALASMIYGINERKGFILITGEVGTGKTTLIHALLNYLDEKTKTAFIFHTNITFEELLKNILVELKLPVGEEGKTAHLRVLNEYLIERLSRGENLAIVIDEAQNLSREVLEELRMLSNLETSKSKLLQILLVGQPELETKLNSQNLRQLKQRIGIRRQISPLSTEESVSYIDHRLRLVGSSSSKIFTSEAISLICDYAGGIPRTINIICDNALLIGYSLSRKKIDARIIKEVIGDMEISTPGRPPSLEPFPVNGSQPHIKPWAANHRAKTAHSKTSFFILLIILLVFCVALFLVLEGKYIKRVSSGWRDILAIKELFSDILPKKKMTDPVSSEPISTSRPPIDGVKSENIKKASRRDGLPNEAKADSTQSTNINNNQVTSGESGLTDNSKTSSDHSMANGIENSPVSLLDRESSSMTPIPGDAESSKPNIGIKKIIAVKKMECLFALARQHYPKVNETVIDLILESNPDVQNVHLIHLFQEIRIPEITEESLIIQQSDYTYKIHLGTFPTRESAKIYMDEPALKGKELEAIARKVAPRETWFRVIAGKFEDKSECLKVISVLKKKSLLPCLARR